MQDGFRVGNLHHVEPSLNSVVGPAGTTRLEPKVMQVLVCLAARAGQVVPKERLMRTVWPDTFVGDDVLTRCISELRRVLGDDVKEPRFIQTIPKSGYRLIAPVSSGADEDTAAPGQDAPGEPVPEGRGMLPDASRVSRRGARMLWRWARAGLALAAVAGGAWQIAVMLRPPTPPPPREPTLTQLTANPPDLAVTSARISPDGRYLAYADPTGIQVRLIERGETQRLSDTRGLSVGTWSEDGTKILAWACVATTCTGWDVSLVGGRRRPSGAVWASTDFTLQTPDGSRLLRCTPPGRELWVDFVNGSPPRLLVRVAGEGDSIRSASWSADANSVLFTRDKTPAVIESVSITGGASSPLFKADGGQQIVDTGVELRDGRLLTVVRHAEHDAVAVFEIVPEVKAGIARRSSRRLTEWRPRALIGQLSASLDGRRVAFIEGMPHEQVYVARFDARVGRLVDTPRRVTMDERGTSPSDWTPDGRAVLFDSPRNGSWDIFEQDLTTESVEPLVAGPGDQVMARVTSDGQWVLFTELSSDRAHGPVRIMRVPTSGGVPHEVFASTTWAFPRCSAHGQCVLFEQRGDQMVISSLDAVRGKGGELAAVPLIGPGEALLADGNRVAFIIEDARPRNRIRVVSLLGHPARDIVVDKATALFGLDATPDGSGLFSSNESAGELLYIRLDGTSHVLWTNPISKGAVWANSSHDGTHLTLSTDTPHANAWLLTELR